MTSSSDAAFQPASVRYLPGRSAGTSRYTPALEPALDFSSLSGDDIAYDLTAAADAAQKIQQITEICLLASFGTMRINTPRNVRVMITRPPPAPMMEGFDVGSYRKGVLYDVEYRLGHYLISAGYAVAGLQPLLPSQQFSSPGEHQLRRAEDRIREELHDSRAKTIGPVSRRYARSR